MTNRILSFLNRWALILIHCSFLVALPIGLFQILSPSTGQTKAVAEGCSESCELHAEEIAFSVVGREPGWDICVCTNNLVLQANEDYRNRMFIQISPANTE